MPILVAAWHYGTYGGILAGLLGSVANTFLFKLTGMVDLSTSVLIGGLIGMMATVIVGGAFGYLAGLRREYAQKLMLAAQLERQLRQSEYRYRSVVQLAGNVIIFVSSDNSRIVEWNQEAERVFGWKREEVLEDSYFERFVPQRHHEAFRRDMARVMASDSTWQFQNKIIDRSGQKKHMLWRLTAYSDVDGVPQGVVAAGQNITEWYQMLSDVQESEARLRMVLETALDAVVMTDSKGIVEFWNHQAEIVFGWTCDEALHKSWFKLTIPEWNRSDFQQYMQAYLETRAGDGEYFNARVESTALHKDGHEFPIELTITPVHQHSDVRFCIFVRDISRRQKLQKQAIELGIHREKLNMLQELMGNVSHDLKTPLTIINTHLYLLEFITDDGEALEKIDQIRQQTQNLDKIVQDILTFSRLEHGPDLNLTQVNINKLIRNIVEWIEPVANHRHVGLSIDLVTDSDPLIFADERAIMQALINLIENAVNYTLVGGHVTVSTRVLNEMVEFRVKDTGIGILPEDTNLIFERFFRADPARSTETGGTGLGLSIVKRVAELHNGTITVDSVVDEGSTFTLRLPHVNIAKSEIEHR
jgi:PAS domain S-box-containing protein